MVVVGVHGIGWHWRSRAEMRETWQTALRTGLENVRFPDCAGVSLSPAYYGHLYNAGTAKSAGEPVYTAADVEEGFETELLEAMAAAAGPEPGAAAGSAPGKGVVVRNVQVMLNIVQRTPYLGGMSTSAVIRVLKQVHRYFEDTGLRTEIRAEVAAAVRPGTRVVVAHSLGTVAAYETLWAHPEWEIDTFVTLGSPLGLKAVQARLDPAGGAKPGRPPSVRRWVNIAAEQDIVALEKRLGPRYGGAVEDFVVTNPLLRFHDCERYLSNVRTARAVAAALG